MLPRRHPLKRWVLAPLLAACAAGPEDAAPRHLHTFRGATMGTYYAVKIAAEEALPPERIEALEAVIEAELADVNGKMSTYLPDSELSRFNRHRETTPFDVSAETFEVVAEALEVGRLAGGALDVTVGPLVNAWGFGAEAPPARLGDAEIAGLLERVGPDKLELDAEGRRLRKLHPELYVDLSSIAKGYGVDRVFEALRAEGPGDLWVEIGGEVRAAGSNAEGRAWRLGIERPQFEPGALQRIVPLCDAAVATSGDYRNYRERDGARFSHIIDPRTGWPIRHRLASVSVVDPRCARADALATALMVLGPEDGFELAVREGLAALFLVRDGDGFSERLTPAFEALIRPAAGGEQPREER